GGKLPVIRALLDHAKPRQAALDAALFAAKDKNDVREALEKAGAAPLKPASEKDRETWKPLAGTYESENGGKLTVELAETGITIRRFGTQQPLKPVGPDTFSPLGLEFATYTFERKGGSVYRVILKQFTAEVSFYNLEKALAKPVTP